MSTLNKKQKASLDSSKTIKVAIVGCGQIAEAHLNEIAFIPEAEVVAVCDRIKLLAEDTAERYGVQNVFSDHKEMLDRLRLDVVHITTPPNTHYSIGIDVLNSGCHAYIEKPFGISYRDANELISIAISNRLILCAGFFQIFDLATIKLRKFISSGRLGRVIHVESYYGNSMEGNFSHIFLHDRDHWIHALPGKLFQNIISHALYHIVPFFPGTGEKIICFAWDGTDNGIFLDELRVMIQSGSISGYLTFSSSVRPITQFIRIFGTKAIVELDLANHSFSHKESTNLPGPIGRVKNSMTMGKQLFCEGLMHGVKMSTGEDRFFAGMGNLFRQFYKNIKAGNLRPPVSYDTVLKCSAIMDEISKQCHQIESRPSGLW